MSYKITWDFIWNHIHTLEEENGLIYQESPNSYYTPRRIKSLYERYQEKEHKSNKIIRSFEPSLNPSAKVLSSFPGYGENTIKKVAKKFSTLRLYFNATVKERIEVEDIGPVLGNRIDEILDADLITHTEEKEVRE